MAYIKSENIFQIAKEHKLPFFVKRNTWNGTVFLVQKIEPKGNYGKVYGILQTAESSKYMELKCAGCYQWIFLKEEVKND